MFGLFQTYMCDSTATGGLSRRRPPAPSSNVGVPQYLAPSYTWTYVKKLTWPPLARLGSKRFAGQSITVDLICVTNRGSASRGTFVLRIAWLYFRVTRSLNVEVYTIMWLMRYPSTWPVLLLFAKPIPLKCPQNGSPIRDIIRK